MRCKTVLLLALGAALLQAEDAPRTPAIQAAELIGHVRRLASDEWAGRGTGTDGERSATEYIAAHFERLGLAPAGEKGGFFQEVSVPDRVEVDPACRLELLGADAPLALDKDWRPFSLSTSGRVEGDVVFAGYGIRAKDLGYDDYAGLDVSGKIVVVFRHLPHGTPAWRAPAARRKHAPFVAKLNHAIAAGAVGLVVVNDPHNFPAAAAGKRRRRPDRVQRGNLGAGPRRIAFAHLTLAAARRVFPALLGATPEALEAAIHTGPAPAPASRPGSARLRLDLKVQPTFVTGRNVCALLAAGAPDAKNEVVVVGAHHDHLGKGGAFGSLARSREERLQVHNQRVRHRRRARDRHLPRGAARSSAAVDPLSDLYGGGAGAARLPLLRRAPDRAAGPDGRHAQPGHDRTARRARGVRGRGQDVAGLPADPGAPRRGGGPEGGLRRRRPRPE
jgi:hypothetical protein